METKLLETVGKLVNRATSDNKEESEAAARGALGRLRRAGETFEAYLAALDPDAVFQSGLVRVTDQYAFGREDLSEPAKRELYALLVRSISAKYSGGAESAAGESDAAKEEELRRREEELDRREREASERESRRGAAENPGSGGDGGFSFSPARRRRFPKELEIWKTDPREAFRIYSAGALFGAFAAVVTTLASAFLFAWLGSVPAEIGGLPTLAVMSAAGIIFGGFRVWAEFRPALRDIFQMFP
jgi:hypothetical protein